jgi:hypothetical protein
VAPCDFLCAQICGINSTVNGKDCVLKTKSIFASPDYFPDKVDKVGDIARYVCRGNADIQSLQPCCGGSSNVFSTAVGTIHSGCDLTTLLFGTAAGATA